MTRHPTLGITLGVDFSGGTGYTDIIQVRDVEGPGVEREAIPVPFDHDMVGGDYQKKFAGISVPGQLSFSLNWDPTATMHAGSTATGLWGSFNALYNGTSLPRWQYQNAQITGGTATFVFRGFVQSFTPNMGAVQGSTEAELVIEVSGKPTLTVT